MNAWQKALLEGQVMQMEQINVLIGVLVEVRELLKKIEAKEIKP